MGISHHYSLVFHKDITWSCQPSFVSFGKWHQIFQGFQEQPSGMFKVEWGYGEQPFALSSEMSSHLTVQFFFVLEIYFTHNWPRQNELQDELKMELRVTDGQVNFRKPELHFYFVDVFFWWMHIFIKTTAK